MKYWVSALCLLFLLDGGGYGQSFFSKTAVRGRKRLSFYMDFFTAAIFIGSDVLQNTQGEETTVLSHGVQSS